MQLKSYHQTKMALGSDTTLYLVVESAINAEELFQKVWRLIYNFERQFSRFLPASELSLFNKAAGVKRPITPEFLALLHEAKRLAVATDGLYNPFILPALQRAGYVASAAPGYEHDPVEDYRNRQVVTPDQLEIGEDWASIPYGTAIDMGGCGKGYLADQIADMLDAAGVNGYWLSLGGDMVTSGTDQDNSPWVVTIQSADPNRELAPVVVRADGKRLAVATSGTFQRSSQVGKKKWHHLIDPRTLKPAKTDILLATVVDSRAIQADVLASCAAIVGSKKAVTYLKVHGAMAAVLQARKASQVVLHHFGSVVEARTVLEASNG